MCNIHIWIIFVDLYKDRNSTYLKKMSFRGLEVSVKTETYNLYVKVNVLSTYLDFQSLYTVRP